MTSMPSIFEAKKGDETVGYIIQSFGKGIQAISIPLSR